MHIYFASTICKEHVLKVRRDKRWETEFSPKGADNFGRKKKKISSNIKMQVVCVWKERD